MSVLDLAWSIDMEQGTVTLNTPDGVQTATIEELLSQVFWLRSREENLRQMVLDRYPIEIRKPMRLVNGYFIGCCADRRLVRVSLERYKQQEVEETDRATRLFISAQEYQHKIRYSEQEIDRELPSWEIDKALQPLQGPEFWVNHQYNEDLGKLCALP